MTTHIHKLLVLLVALLIVWASWGPTLSAQTPMVVYLAPYDGTGTRADPFRVRGQDKQTKCIGLRANPAVATGRALCARATLPTGTGYTQLADRLDNSLTAPRRAALQAALGVTITASNIVEVVAEILIQHGRTDGSRWRPLTPTREGKYEIYLTPGTVPTWQQTASLYPFILDGGMVADAKNWILAALEPPSAWAASFTANFNCADSASLSCGGVNWTEIAGTGWRILSNAANLEAAATLQIARVDHDLATSDMEVTATLTQFTRIAASSMELGVIGRKDATGTQTFYLHAAIKSGSPDFWEMGYFSGGSYTFLDSATQTINTNDVNVLRLDGSAITGLVNGATVNGPITDVTITGNTRGGVYGYGVTASDSATFDNLSVIDYTASPSSYTAGPRRRGI